MPSLPLSGSATAPRLEMIGIRKRFGATVALDGVDLAVPAGVVHALVGENGAGKSTLVKVLSGAIDPDAGEMRLDGIPFDPRNPLEARHCGVAMIYQELSLARHLTVEENINLGIEPSQYGWVRRSEARARARQALEQLEHPEIPLDAPVGLLSIAAQQLVEIARALAIGCRVLVFDEPTSSLALRDIERLFVLIRRLILRVHEWPTDVPECLQRNAIPVIGRVTGPLLAEVGDGHDDPGPGARKDVVCLRETDAFSPSLAKPHLPDETEGMLSINSIVAFDHT